MNGSSLFALLPIIVFSAGTVFVMLLAAFWRRHWVIASFSLLTIIATLATLPIVADAAPQSITSLLVLDDYALYFMALMLATVLIIVLVAFPYLEGSPLAREEFYLLILLGTLGALILACAQHFASMVLGIELLGIALFALTAYAAYRHDGHASLESGMKYLVLSGVASALMLFGMALLYAEAGDLGFASMATIVDNPSLLVFTGVAMLLAGVGFKLSLVPFHLWTPDVYQGAPAPVTAFIATVSKGAIFAVLYRLMLTSNLISVAGVAELVLALAVLSMLVGNWLALLQNNVKRLLAYSSIAHLGYLLIPLVTLKYRNLTIGVEAACFYVLAYMVTSLAAFSVLSLHSQGRPASADIHELEGLFWQRPGLALLMSAALLSLAGIPLTVGFIGKFYLFATGVEERQWLLLWALIIGSAVGLFYYLRVMVTLYKKAEISGETRGNIPFNVSSASAGLSLFLLVVLLIGIGIYPAMIMEHAPQISVTIPTASAPP